MDLFVLQNSRQRGPVNYRPKMVDGSSINTDHLYRNNGDNTFSNVSLESGILKEGYGLGVALLDVNQDGWIDIYVCNDYITNDVLYVNEGNGKFADRIDEYIKHQSKFSMGCDVADINNDGFLDLITVDMLPDNNPRKKTVISGSGYITYINDEKYKYTHQYVRNMLQLNNGNGTFSEIGQLAGVFQTEWSWSPLFADFNNDGLKDLIITNGFPKDITDRDFIAFREKTIGLATPGYLLSEMPSVEVPNVAFMNTGNLIFKDVTKEWGFSKPSFSNGAAYADLDNDGDLDYIVNNVNDFVALYENTLYNGEENKATANFLRFKLKGPQGNTFAIGAKITVKNKGQLQFIEHSVSRGYISSVENVVHFGLGASSIIDTVIVQWPDGKVNLLKNVQANRVVDLDYSSATKGYDLHKKEIPVLVKEVHDVGLLFKHQEESKIDFNIQRTLPKKFSQRGPSIAIGDVNNDGYEDVLIGGSSGTAATVFLQDKNHKFKIRSKAIAKSGMHEDAGLLLFDADNDGDLDLYIARGTYEFQRGDSNQQHELFFNNGKGDFIKQEANLPLLMTSGSCVRASDFEGDGDLDLFIGGSISYGNYPLADPSYVLVNESGKFKEATKLICPLLSNLGIVNDAIWTDFNDDGKIDLIVVGEFLPVTFFRNNGKQLEKYEPTGIESLSGWFNSITGADFDSDGDTDYIVGNLGLNHYYNVKIDQPLSVCAKDFDNNGSIDPVLSCYIKSGTDSVKQYPVHFWDELNSQSPRFRKKFATFKQFGNTPTNKFFTPDELKDAITLHANYMATSFIENKGGGKFTIEPLPVLVQVAPVNGVVAEDIDLDGNPDVILVGNDYSNEPTFGQYDAFTGLVLKGNGKNSFSVIPSRISGFHVGGDAKALAKMISGENILLLASQNQDSLKSFILPFTNLRHFEPLALDQSAILHFQNGKKQKVEFYHGCGYWSQSTRQLIIPYSVEKVEVVNSKGESRFISFSKHP